MVAFFYTRCMNPTKCSLTISRMAILAQHIQTAPAPLDLNLVAISYDPDFDVPARLYSFGRDRGFAFTGEARLIRCLTGWRAVQQAFTLEVGYGGSTVNEHARELFVVSPGLQAIGVDCDALSEPIRMLDEIAAQSLRLQVAPTRNRPPDTNM
ncbi:SCO family protein [Mesorhizobium sp. M1060]